KAPDDLLTRRANWLWQIFSSGHRVSGFFDKFIGHRTTDVRHLTSFMQFFHNFAPLQGAIPALRRLLCHRDESLPGFILIRDGGGEEVTVLFIICLYVD